MFQRTYLLFKLTFRLLSALLFTTPKWIWMATRLLSFVVCLLPGFIRFAWYYFVSGGVRRNIRYGNGQRQLLDIYLPKKHNITSSTPIVVFVTGGAWIIGYKMWGALLGRALTANGVILIIPDYKNFPQAQCDEMADDVNRAIGWIKANVGTGTSRGEFTKCGSNGRIALVGQSAGAHLTSLILLQKLLQSPSDVKRSPQSTRWRPSDLRGFIPISGPYDLLSIKDFMHKKGLDKKILDKIFPSLVASSPSHVADEIKQKRITIPPESFPPVAVIHGSEDLTVPCSMCIQFDAKLKDLGIASEALVYEGWSHTDGILESPMKGDHRLHKDIFDRVMLWTIENEDERWDFDSSVRLCHPLSPTSMVNLGRVVNPF